ncbi:MAG: uridine kinase [Thermotogaceae bacterium]|nr:uridine kinase [Thermotogaceae bacterium]
MQHKKDILSNMLKKDKIKLHFLEDNRDYTVDYGTRLEQFVEKYSEYHKGPILAARFNNSILELSKPVEWDGSIKFIDISELDGLRIYQRSLILLANVAIKRLFGDDKKMIVYHSIGRNLYCEAPGLEITEDFIRKIKAEIKKLVSMDLPIEKITVEKNKAIEFFESLGEYDKVRLFKYRKKKTVKLYKLLDYVMYFYGYVIPRTSFIRVFDVRKYNKGFILMHPDPNVPDKVTEFVEIPKLTSIFLEYEKWAEIMGVRSVGDINQIIVDKKIRDLISVAEALHEKKIALIAEQFMNSKARIILIAGPSSSGKTTFSKRLTLQLRANGLKPVVISLDDYFVDRDRTPLDENGKPDFESIYALDLELFNQNMLGLLNGKEVEIPKFDFKTGRRVWKGKKLRISSDQPLVVEGIHGLNELLTSSIPRELKFKIYVSALTQLNIDDLNRIPTTDTRIIRRMVRDEKFRGHSALDTLKMWPNVRKGEEKYIFPFQEEADAMFNSALIYELAVLKLFAEHLLVQVNNSEPEFSEAMRLLKFLDYFLPITDLDDIPKNSILREFIGMSIFKY